MTEQNQSSRLADTGLEFRNRFRDGRPRDLVDEPTPGEGSTRLADFAPTGFQIRNRLRQQRTERRQDARSQFAEGLELADRQVQSVQLDDRGEEIGFVPNRDGRETLAERFADDRPFTEPDDAIVEANPREGTQTRTDPNARDEIAQRARQDFAQDDRFAQPEDFRVEVGPGGVIEAGFTETGERRRTSRQFEAETALETVGPNDLEARDDGFGLTDSASRRLATRQFEDDIGLFGQQTLDPTTDVRQTDDGFGLGRDPARQLAARDLDEQIPETNVGPDDITLELTEDGFEATFEQETNR
jgi:hypothetical protein